ncbi:MAG: inner membrane CreD family protein, partial [Candidatus Lindowbacteria bacterium]|nr:inner membrane CreD family protein [Candidatus Lindowbacteria bacterium]
PSFTGIFLPKQREISSEGFNATWNVFYLSRNFPQKWKDNTVSMHELQNASFGVDFFKPVDAYVQTDRAIKYALMFILLTFTAFFLFEIFAGLRVHAVQYLLIGTAMCLFYLLLLAFSEHISFMKSYVLASSGTTLLISLYSASVLCGFKRGGGIVAPLLLSLYSYLYILLQAKDFSLLFGAIGLFVILSIFMYLTRNFDWCS